MKVVFFLISMLGATSLFASAVSPDTSASYLRLVHKETQKEIHISQGEIITCHVNKRRIKHGKLGKINADSVEVGEHRLALSDLKAISYFPSHKRWQAHLGGVLRVVSTFVFLLSSIGLASVLIKPAEGADAVFFLLLPICLVSLLTIRLASWLTRKGRFAMHNYQVMMNK